MGDVSMKKVILLFLLFHLQLFSAQTLKEIFVVSAKWEKLTSQDGSGLYFDLVRMIYEPLGIKVRIEIFPYKRSSIMVKKKQADAWLGSYINEEDYAYYPQYYFDHDIVTAMFKKSKFPRFKNQESLKNLNVCWIRGYDYDEFISVAIVKHERNSRKAILFSLEKERFDVFLDARFDMLNAIKELHFDTSKYKLIELFEFKLYPAFTKDSRGKTLRDIWDKQFKKYLDSGEIRALYLKHNLTEYYLY